MSDIEKQIAQNAVLIQNHKLLLEEFIVRARRVSTHSLMQDAEQLAEWEAGIIPLESDDPDSLQPLLFPDEEKLQSLGLRVLPFISLRGQVNFNKVFEALNFLLLQSGAANFQDISLKTYVVGQLSLHEEYWELIDPHHPENSQHGVRVNTSAQKEAEIIYTPQRDLTLAWLRGKNLRKQHSTWQEAIAYDVQQRYESATNMIARLASLSNDIYNLVETLHLNNIITFDQEVFNASISPRTFLFEGEVSVYV